MQFKLTVLLAAVLGANARLGAQEERKLETLCVKTENGFEEAAQIFNAPKRQRTIAGAKNLYEMYRDNIPFPECGDIGQNVAFQGADLWDEKKGECVRANICHGVAGAHGWNRITVDRDSIGDNSNANASNNGANNNGNTDTGHTGQNHNEDGPKNPDYFPWTDVVPNPNGAGANGYLDSACAWQEGSRPANTPAPTTAPSGESPTTAAPTESPTEAPTTLSPTQAPETFPAGSTVDVDGETCILNDECVCEDEDDTEDDKSSLSDVPSGTKGDPHFIMWNGGHFDFHGGCDLVLLDNPDYNNGQGLKIHILTKVKSWFSYVERVAVEIGSDTLELQGGFTSRRFWHNGHVLPTRRLTKVNGVMPFTVGGYEVHYQTQVDHISWKVSIHLPNDQKISLRTIKDYMRVDIEHPTEEYFGKSTGLMGRFQDDAKIARDGSVMTDPIEYGQEWQVRIDEEVLFKSIDGVPQHPEQCIMPALARTTKRLLAESDFTYEDAEKACAHLNKDERDDCIYDVIATNDMDIAGAY
jgi:hypothetical protein